ncbi:SUMF1/EgtB/PvdO family nonheme iron enzyme [Thermoflexibacter ruber]|uniref:Sulfatase modifying factor 1 n=1 Tax=Thermoflexibacter ruber TaxID=1003 RepID=A0A1I2FIG3_9BACT|nr:SUMF1/EgtB/PvdO family nonheme iron enzyme [Thermoflexibacter ruber]SFF04679.1 sulfatase modifying factor 1 [Thermoflexibacter ruber]
MTKYIFILLVFFGWACTQSSQQSYPTPPKGMVYVPAGNSTKAFFMDISPVTVAEFDEFVKQTGYQTEAHRFGNAGVFNIEKGIWEMVEGANYLYPLGKTYPKAEPNHPATQVSWNDAVAYAQWAKKRLPTYQEWKWAAMNADEKWNKIYAWGDELIENGKVYKANVWQGNFPYYSQAEDGFQYTSPVGYYGKTPLGLTDVGGNVWQWCQDWANPQDDTLSPEAEKLQYGGSFLCDENVCHGYKIGNTAHSTPETSLCHVGFRCVKDIE